MKVRNYVGPTDGKNPIKYFVNEEKKTCVAVLENIPWDMNRTVQAFETATDCEILSFSHITEFIKDIPDRITATAKCSDMDEFDAEIGCALARSRVLEKLYRYRKKMMTRMAAYYDSLALRAWSDASYYELRSDSYSDVIDATINETFNNPSNN